VTTDTPLRIVPVREFLRTDVNGHIDLESSREVLRAIVRASASLGLYRVLVDARGTPHSISIADVYDLASDLDALGVTPRHRIATLHETPEGLERAGYFSILARSRGHAIRAFSDFEDALAWLGEP
jgi:hypothetical protein